MNLFLPSNGVPIGDPTNSGAYALVGFTGSRWAFIPAIARGVEDNVKLSYFNSTKNKEFNDCIHSKIVTDAGTTPDVWPNLSLFGYPCTLEGYGHMSDKQMAALKPYYDGAWKVTRSYTIIVRGLRHFNRNWTYMTTHDMSQSVQLNVEIWEFTGNTTGNPVWNRYAATRTRTYTSSRGAISWKTTRTSTPLGADLSTFSASWLANVHTAFRDDETYAECSADCQQVLEAILPLYLAGKYTVTGQKSFKKDYFFSLEGLEAPVEGDFLFHEPERFRKDPVQAPRFDTSQYWLQVAKQHAYLDAIQKVPRLNDNSISNILEIVSFIKSIVVDHEVKVPDSLSEAWLAYRYEYGTSKLDAEEAIKFVKRYRDLGGLDGELTTYGEYWFEYQSSLVTARCEIKLRPKELGQLGKIWRALYTYGLAPSFYVVWDSIPYSFIADWFLPVGNALSVLDARLAYSEERYEFTHVSYSLSYRRQVGNNTYKFYYRWWEGVPLSLDGIYFLEPSNVKARTIGYRILDALSLVLG